mgnify:CR=1 FL=1|tara:strand:- start:6781 stop:8364 length:1584 start_codon:yes stop_codon:yes gene_type:complete
MAEDNKPKKDNSLKQDKSIKRLVQEELVARRKISKSKEEGIKASKQLKELAGDIKGYIIDTSKAQTHFQKSLGLSVGESLKLTKELAKSATFSRNANVSFVQSAKAISLINSNLGIGSKLVAKQAEDIGRFALSLGMSEKSQANLAKRSIQTGKSVEGLVLSQIRITKGVEAEFGTRLNIAEVIDKANSLSGQVRAQLGGNVEELTKAVAVAKELGFEINAIAGSSKSLLDFQGSIESELEAELLTGKQLNLEQARLFALTGDYVGLTKEIAENVGDFYEFSKLNVLQQDAIAKSVGMTSDQLSDQLFDQASITELKEKAREENDLETLANLEQLDIQKQFEQLTLKVQGAFIAIASTLTPVFKGFSFMAKNADLLLAATAGMATYSTIIAITTAKTEKSLVRQLYLTIRKSAASIIGAAIANPVAAGIGLAVGVGAVAMMRSKARSIGGPVNAGESYMVGERGPELIVPPNSGTVIPNNQLSGGGGKGRSDTEIISLATKAAARSISVDFNTPKFNSLNSLDAVFA